jgi:hypothetical protein
MDIEDEVMTEPLTQDEVEAATDQEQRIMVLATLLCYREKLNIVPRCVWFEVGKAKNKDRHRFLGALFLDSDYFADNASNSPK